MAARKRSYPTQHLYSSQTSLLLVFPANSAAPLRDQSHGIRAYTNSVYAVTPVHPNTLAIVAACLSFQNTSRFYSVSDN